MRVTNLRGALPFDRGRKAALNGLSLKDNPFNHPESQNGNSCKWEQFASAWDEGWWAGESEILEKESKC